MVAILEKGEFNSDFHPMVDFIAASPLRIVSLFDTMLVHQGKGSGTPTEPHHTPFPEAKTSHPTTLSIPLPSIPTAPIPSVTQPDTTPIRQYSRKARIAQSSALPTVADEPASLVRDVSEGEACPTDSGFIADQDRATIAKSSTLPHDSAPRVTSPATDEGSMQHNISELTALYTSLQRQYSELLAKFQAQEEEIIRLKERVQVLEDREGVPATQSGDNAPIKGRSINKGEAAAERISNDSEEIARVLTSIDAATVLAGGIDVPTGSGFIPTAGPPATVISTGSEVCPTASPIATRRKGKEVMVESDTPKMKKLQEQIDAQVARELEEQQEKENMRMNEQIARDAEVARIHAEEELQGMIDSLDKSNEIIAKYLQECQDFASELPLEKRIELISDLVKYQDNYSKVYKFQSQQRRPMTKKQKREYYIAVIKSNLGWRLKISKEETERLKRKGLNLEKEQVKKQKLSEEAPEIETSTEEFTKVKIKEMMQEDLNQLWALVKGYLSIRPATKWKLYDQSGVHHLTAKDREIFMLVEKDYHLIKGLALVMISYKLQVENYSQMAEDLIRKIYNIANAPRGGLLGIKCTRHSHYQVKSSHWQYKFPLLVKVVATARRLEMPLPEVCTAIEEKKKKLPVKDRWHEIWKQLEIRFSFSDASRKYKLNKDTYEITQFGISVGEYYTRIKCVWEDLDNLNVLLVISVITLEIVIFLAALNKKNKEERLFQFMNGLGEYPFRGACKESATILLMTNVFLKVVNESTLSRVIDGVVQPVAPTTAKQKLARKNELKARETLLMALLDKHQLKFNIHKDAKSLMKDIKKSTNEFVSAVTGVSTASTKVSVSTLPNVDILSDDVIYSFFASQSNREGILQGSRGHLGIQGIKTLQGGMFQWRLLLWYHSVMVLVAMIGAFRQMKNQQTMPSWHSPPQVLQVLKMSSESDVSMPPSPVHDSTTKPNKNLSQSNRPSAPIIEDWVSDSEDESEVEHHIPVENLRKDIPKSQGHRHSWIRKACFVCKSLTYLIKDYDYYEKKMVQKPVRNHAQRGNHQHYARMLDPHPHRHVVPITVLTRSRLVPFTAARPVTTVVPQTKVQHQRPTKHGVTKAPSPIRRPINLRPSATHSNFHQKVTTVKANQVNAIEGVKGNWVNPQHALQDKGVIDSGCSRHMTVNISYLSDFEAINGKYVAFGRNPKGGKITGKGKIKTEKLDFDDVYFVKELKFNLFSVSQICDKKNSVLFTCTECIVLSFDFKLPDENHADEGFFVGYSVSSKAFRVFNSRTRIIQETLHINFLENQHNVAESGPTWLFDIDTLTQSMNYQLVVAVNQHNSSAGIQEHFDTVVPRQRSMLTRLKRKAKGKSSVELSTGVKNLSEEFKDFSSNGTNGVNAASTPVTAVEPNSTNSTNTFTAAGPSNNDEECIDYEEVFAPVARIEAIRLFLAYASFMGFMVYQMDVKSAFLYETIEEEVYVCQPPGFKDLDYPDKVYVDDIIFGSTNKDLCKSFEKLMKDKFQMSSMGELTFFLGLQVKQKKDGIFISQDKYVAEILRKFGLTDGKSASTPIDTKKSLHKDPDGEDVDVHTYMSMIGLLMYLTSSRPYIMFAICACAHFQVTSKALHLHAVKRIFSDYAGASLNRKSTIGGCQFLGYLKQYEVIGMDLHVTNVSNAG
nr:ribonuclease H-like domain, reverse transcriptase, RNA-dependent DNA polymerase [Tanacetum cinerariifolium]